MVIASLRLEFGLRHLTLTLGAKQRPAVVAMLKTIFAQESADAGAVDLGSRCPAGSLSQARRADGPLAGGAQRARVLAANKATVAAGPVTAS